MKTVIRIYTPFDSFTSTSVTFGEESLYAVVLVAFIILNVVLGITSQPVVDMIQQGLAAFA